jgi:hypothetical protein
VGDDDGGDAEALLQLAQLDLHVLAQVGVQRRQRLVEQKDLRVDGKAAGDRDTLALPARQLVDAPVADIRQAHQVQQLGRPLAPAVERSTPRIASG